MPKEDYVYRAKDFYEQLEEQNYKCFVTGRELTPMNCTAEHLVPLKKGGQHIRENIVLLVRDIAPLKRNLSEEEIVLLAVDVIKAKGKAYGFKAIKSGKSKRK